MVLDIAPESWFWLALTTLGAWRLTGLLCHDAGPFHLLIKARRVARRFRLGGVLDCFHCASVWVSALLVLFTYRIGWGSPLLLLSVSAGVSLLEIAAARQGILEEGHG